MQIDGERALPSAHATRCACRRIMRRARAGAGAAAVQDER
jgi:hypothetical protein